MINSAIGDGFAFVGFMQAWSDIYQGQKPSFMPTLEKFYLPEPKTTLRGSHSSELNNISWAAIDVDEETFQQHAIDADQTTTRLDYRFEAAFVNDVVKNARQESQNERLSTGDAFAGYLINSLRSIFDEPPRFIQQCVGVCVFSRYHFSRCFRCSYEPSG